MLLLLPLLALATPPKVTPPTVPATGHAEARVEVDGFGRYALEVASPRGTSVQLVDKMAGPGPADGRAGERDGRIDVFLDRGEVKLWLESATDGTGEAEVKATRFEELQGPDLPLLLPLREETGTLGDKEQRSWWIDLPERQTISLEAAARHLGDLRVWKDGTWLHPASPTCTTIEPVEGQPWRDCTLETQLEPGLYRVAVYGAPSLPWTEDSDAAPMWVRYGVPELGVPAEHRLTLDDKGFARFVIPGGAQSVRIALPANTANASVGVGSVAHGFARSHSAARITDESRVPEAVQRTSSGRQGVLVTGQPGQTLTLQVLPPVSWSRTLSSGRHVMTSIVGAHDADVLPPTGVVYRKRPDRPTLVIEDYAIALERGHRFEERFNLLSDTTMLVRLPSEGSWRFEIEGDAYVSVEPFLLDHPRGYQSPKPSSHRVESDFSAGLHLVHLRVVKAGIVTLKMGPDTWTRSARNLVGNDLPVMEVRPVLQDLDFGAQNGDVLWVFGAPDVLTATSVREAPVDLTQPLALTVMPGEKPALRVRIPERGVLTATAPDGTPLRVRVEGGAWEEVAEVRPSDGFTVELDDPGNAVTRVNLAWRPHTHLPETAPPPLTAAQKATLPEFPVLTADQPSFLDLDRTASSTWAVSVDEPALYQLQSTGLLATAGSLRTRVQTGFAQGNQNGVGRNFQVSRYLGSGDYQLTVTAQGASRGHLGLELVEATRVDGGPLLDGQPARLTLKAGDAVAYGLDVAEESHWRIESMGLGRNFTCRIEDGDGYPILSPPDQHCGLSLRLRPGHYTVLVTPERTDSRRITRAVKSHAAVATEGHGPHAIAVEQAVDHVWTEPSDKEAARPPDVWTFTLPATATTAFALSETMTGVLTDAAGAELGRLLPGEPLERVLDAGAYRLELRAARRDHGVRYRLVVQPRPMTAGVERAVYAPTRIPVAVGGDGAVTLASFGNTDVRARLEDGNGEVVATSDDRPDDWNFRIETRVAPGDYTLVVDPVAGGSAATRVAMAQPAQVDEPAIADGQTRSFVPGTAVHAFVVDRSPGDVVVARATSTESLGLAVEALVDGRWIALGTETGRDVVLPAWSEAATVRVRVWSLDPRGAEATLEVSARGPQRAPEGALGRTVRLGGKAPLVPLRVKADSGVFRVAHADPLWQCAPDRPCTRVIGDQVPAEAHGLWLVGKGSLTALRIDLAPGKERRVEVPADGDRAVDLAERDGPAVVVARSRAGTPVARLTRDAVDGAPAFADVALSGRATAAVDLHGTARYLQLRSGDGEVLESRLSTWHFATPKPEKMGEEGLVDGTLAPGAAARVKLPGGPHQLRAILDAGVVLALASGKQTEAVRWADAEPRAFAELTAAQEAWVLNTSDRTAAYRLVATPHDGAVDDRMLAGEAAVSWAAPDAVTRTVAITTTEGTLRVHGGTGRLLDDAGRVHDLADLPATPGTAWIDAAPGVGAVWATPAAVPGGKAQAVRPGPIALSGRAMRLRVQGVGLVELGLSEPAEVTILGPEPVATVLAAGGWVRHVTAEPVDLVVRGLAGRPLTGTAELRVSKPVPIAEGVGPEVLLGPGEARAFAFETPRDGPIGLGVQATADRVEATLYSGGVALGTGLVQMTEVAAGAHVLVLHLPSDAAPVRARPVLTGTAPPDTGPPEEVVRRYLELASEAP